MYVTGSEGCSLSNSVQGAANRCGVVDLYLYQPYQPWRAIVIRLRAEKIAAVYPFVRFVGPGMHEGFHTTQDNNHPHYCCGNIFHILNGLPLSLATAACE